MASMCDYAVKKDDKLDATFSDQNRAIKYFKGQCNINSEEFNFMPAKKITLEFEENGFPVFLIDHP